MRAPDPRLLPRKTGPSTGPDPPPARPGPTRPGLARHPPARHSPSNSRWMMLSMLSLSISAIAVPPPTLPQQQQQRRCRPLAPGSHSSFLTPRAPRAVVAAAVAAAAAAGPPPQPPRSAPGFLLLSPLRTTRRTRWPPTPQASLGRRTDARAGVQRPGRDFFTGP